MDGSGYPMGLRGKSITEGTMIIEFSDIISALMENRPYRQGMSIDKALNIIENKMSSYLDIDIFNLIKNHKEEINGVVQYCHLNSFAAYENNI